MSGDNLLLLGGSGVSAYQIQRSLRFNSADSAYLSRTPASAGNQKTYTVSVWFKRSAIGASGFSFLSVGTSTGSPRSDWGFNQDLLAIGFNPSGGAWLEVDTSALYRDVSAWYHVVVAVDTTQATSTDRVKLYVNGSLVTAFVSASYPSQNSDTLFNGTGVHAIGRYNAASNSYYSGYMAEYYMIDGQALTPSSFGQTNSNTGVWEPKAYSGTYGTNGFYLNFSDNSGTTSTTLGKDYSGNGNNWTPNNFSVTAGAGNDSLVDTPTPYGTDTGLGGEVRGNYCTWNPLKVGASVTVNNGNLYASGTTGANNLGVTATMGFSTGKWYWEIYCDTGANSNDAMLMAIVQVNSLVTDAYPGVNSTSGWAWRAQGSGILESSSNITVNYTPASYTNGDTIMCAFDADAGKVWLGVNGTWSGSGVPASGTNPAITYTASEAPYIPAARVYNASCFANFGQRAFAYTAPSGFKALCTQNLSTPTVVQGDDYFNTVLYTGNGSTQSITGVGFQPDFVWNKARSAAYSHRLADVLRGATNLLNTDSTTAAFTDANSITSFNADGFSVGNSFDNTNAVTYVAWNWKANGAGVTNTAGSITSTVSANTTSGFSVVTYTGTGSAATVGHGLGTAPSMIIIKIRNSGAENWLVYHASLSTPSTAYLLLNATDSSATLSNYWNGGPTSSVFGVGAYSGINGNTSTYVAYCFAAIPGYSAFGSYTGNGSSDGPFVYCGFRPAFVLYKESSATNSWVLLDDKRNTYNGSTSAYLYPDLSLSEQNTTAGADFLSNGFKLRTTNSELNANSQTYIYAAFAENPFKYALAR
jgi:hypothetical protein